MRVLAPLALLLLLFNAVPAGAASAEQAIVERLRTARPDLEIGRVVPAEAPGIYRVELSGQYSQQYLHVTADGRYMFAGDLFEIGDGSLVNVSDHARQGVRKVLLDAVPVDQMIVFRPAGQTRAVVSVFTDVDCGYCQKLHREMADMNARGIEVRYLAYPRAGVGSESYDKIVTAWCSDNPGDALTRLKARQAVAARTCENPVAAQYALGRQIGIQGTPAIVLQSGEVLPGYLPAAELAAHLGI